MTDCAWDQRISNEAIYKRQFNDRGDVGAPNIPQSGPTSSRPYTVHRPYLLLDSRSEGRALTHWLKINNMPVASLSKMRRRYPGRPWIYSIHRNIDVDSELSSRNYYNPKDCMTRAPPLLDANIFADADISPQCKYASVNSGSLQGVTRNCLNIWNQPTRGGAITP
jgi:hypothetical protein